MDSSSEPDEKLDSDDDLYESFKDAISCDWIKQPRDTSNKRYFTASFTVITDSGEMIEMHDCVLCVKPRTAFLSSLRTIRTYERNNEVKVTHIANPEIADCHVTNKFMPLPYRKKNSGYTADFVIFLKNKGYTTSRDVK